MPNSKETIEMDVSDHVKTEFESLLKNTSTASDKGVKTEWTFGGEVPIADQIDSGEMQNELESTIKRDGECTNPGTSDVALPEGCLVHAQGE